MESATPVGTGGGTTTLDGSFYQSGQPVPDVTVWIGGVECTAATVVVVYKLHKAAAAGHIKVSSRILFLIFAITELVL